MKYCQDCGAILKGRTDKKFCDDHCRCHYNNAINKDRCIKFKEINSILKKNTAILENLVLLDINHASKHLLLSAGFNFSFFTHQLYEKNGKICFCCYNYGYIKINEEEFILKQISHLLNPDKKKHSSP